MTKRFSYFGKNVYEINDWMVVIWGPIFYVLSSWGLRYLARVPILTYISKDPGTKLFWTLCVFFFPCIYLQVNRSFFSTPSSVSLWTLFSQDPSLLSVTFQESHPRTDRTGSFVGLPVISCPIVTCSNVPIPSRLTNLKISCNNSKIEKLTVLFGKLSRYMNYM